MVEGPGTLDSIARQTPSTRAKVRFTFPGSPSRVCASMTGSLVFVSTRKRVAIIFPGLIFEANCE
jgi:hypothetical protein